MDLTKRGIVCYYEIVRMQYPPFFIPKVSWKRLGLYLKQGRTMKKVTEWACVLLVAAGFCGMEHQVFVDAEPKTLIPYGCMFILGIAMAVPIALRDE